MEAFNANDYAKAKDMSVSFLEKGKSANDVYYITKTYFLLGYLCSHTDDYGNAVIYYLEGARYAELSNREDLKGNLISIYKNLGLILGDYKYYDLAHKFINKGLNVARETGNEKQVIALANNKVHEFIDEERFEDAKKEIDSLLTLENYPPELIPELYNKAGLIYLNLNDTIKAVDFFNLTASSKHDYDENTANAYSYSLSNMGCILLEQKKIKSALTYFFKAYEYDKKRENKLMEFYSLNNLGEAFFKSANYQQSLLYFQKAIAISEEGDRIPEFYEAFKNISSVYSILNDYPKALEYERIYSEELEKFIEQQREIEELDKKYNIELLTERYFDLLAADAEQKETERNAKISISGTAILFLIILSVIFYRQFRTKRSIRKKLLEIDFSSEV